MLKKKFPKLLVWISCRKQFWKPCWKTFVQRPEVFRAKTEIFSQNKYFGHVESNLDNPAENFQLKLRKVFENVHLNSVPSHLKKRSFVTPNNEGTQKAVLTNVWKSFLLEARKTFNKLVTQEWSLGRKWLSFYDPPNLYRSKSERTAFWFRKNFQNDNLDT